MRQWSHFPFFATRDDRHAATVCTYATGPPTSEGVWRTLHPVTSLWCAINVVEPGRARRRCFSFRTFWICRSSLQMMNLRTRHLWKLPRVVPGSSLEWSCWEQPDWTASWRGRVCWNITLLVLKTKYCNFARWWNTDRFSNNEMCVLLLCCWTKHNRDQSFTENLINPCWKFLCYINIHFYTIVWLTL